MQGGLTILSGEDNIGDTVLIKEAFAEANYNVRLLVIPNGEQALHYLRVKESARDAPPPDAIFLDGHLTPGQRQGTLGLHPRE